MMKKKEAVEAFMDAIMPGLFASEADLPARRQAWSEWVEQAIRNGDVSPRARDWTHPMELDWGPVDYLDPMSLDPGIRRPVVWLRSLGYRTSDSGDGVSKPEAERSLDQPHVFIVVSKSAFFDSVDRLTAQVAELGLADPEEWDPEPPSDLVLVQGQYADQVCTISVIGLHEGNLPEGLGR